MRQGVVRRTVTGVRSKECKFCGGKGFVNHTIELPGNTLLPEENQGIRLTCGKCFGRGKR